VVLRCGGVGSIPPLTQTVLTLALVYGAYTETGVFTALSLLLIFVATAKHCAQLEGLFLRRKSHSDSC